MIVEIRDEVVLLSGSLQRNQWRTLESAVRVRLRHHPNGIVLDLGGLTDLNAEGAETFRDALSHFKAQNKRIVVARVPADVMKSLRQSRDLVSQLPVATTIEEARSSLGLSMPTAMAEGRAASATILVGLLGSDADPHAVAVAVRLAQGAATAKSEAAHGKSEGTGSSSAPSARVILVHALQVPRDRPLMASLGEEEEAATAALTRLHASVRAARVETVSRIERTRDRAARLLAVAAEVKAGTIVLALGPEASEELAQLADTVLARAACEVIVNRLPPPVAKPAATATTVKDNRP